MLCTLAAYAFARFEFPGRGLLFALVLVQLMVMPDVLIVENYRTMSALGLSDTIVAIGLPYMASAFGIFLLRQTFKTVPAELDEAARIEGCTPLQVLWKVYVPLARPVYLAYALVSVSYHWNNFLWPLIITNSVESRPLTVGLQVFSADRSGHRLVDHHCGDAADHGPAADRVPAVPATIRAVLHEGRNQVKLITWNTQWCRGVDGRSTRRGSSGRRSRSPISTCSACRKSPTIFPIRASPAATARTSSLTVADCCPATSRCPGSRSTYPRRKADGATSAT